MPGANAPRPALARSSRRRFNASRRNKTSPRRGHGFLVAALRLILFCLALQQPVKESIWAAMSGSVKEKLQLMPGDAPTPPCRHGSLAKARGSHSGACAAQGLSGGQRM